MNANAGADNQCFEKLRKEGLLPICAELPDYDHRCEEVVKSNPHTHKACMDGHDPFMPVPIVACVRFGENGEIVDSRYFPWDKVVTECRALGEAWDLTECYCCCDSGDWSVATPDGGRAMRAVAPGDRVLAGFLPQRGGRITWRPLPVALAETVPLPEDAAVVQLGFVDREVVCPENRILMDGERRLVRARAVVVGDRLCTPRGDTVEVVSVTRGEAKAPIPHIATEAPRRDGGGSAVVEGHLLAIDGLVTGDLVLEILFDAIPADRRVTGRDGDRLEMV